MGPRALRDAFISWSRHTSTNRRKNGVFASRETNMKTALFTNFSNEDFTGYWDGKGKTFKAGQSMYMPDYLAQHFAKHLTNRELLRLKPDGSPVYKDGEKMTSPKKPEQVPLFMELFDKAYTPDEDEPLNHEGDSIDASIATANKNREKRNAEKQDPNGPQIILPPEDDEDDGDESSFEEQPAPTGAQSTPAGLSL